MCGICGQFNFQDDRPVERDVIVRMARAMVHRGPDDEGFHFSGSVGLGFRRLSIIDLQGGHQPMSDREATVWVVFNGEIYNFPELRGELEAYGHVFQTRSDTEVIVHGYKQWGLDVLNHLNGMFGLAIWDERQRRLVIARDAMGIKLIYYRLSSGRVTFGSEIRSVRAAGGEVEEIDPVSLNLFLRYRYAPAPYTLFKGVRKLAAGTMLVLEGGTCRLERWYRFKPLPFAPAKSDAEAKGELLALYKKAVKRHLLSDVPVGLLLSGGIDSGLLLGLMKLNGDSWPTYTVGYGKGYRDDELADAARTAQIFSSVNNQVRLARSQFEEALPRIVACLEEPIASSSIVPMYFVCQRARQDVKVALVGQGPDELFGGYTRHLGVRYGAAWRALPGFLRRPLMKGVEALPRNEALKRGVYALDSPGRLRRYQQVFSIMPAAVVDDLFQDGVLSPGAGDTILKAWQDLDDLMEGTDELGGLQFLEVRSSLPDELLMYADKLSMAHSLEVRVPYLDREIVEYVERLPARFKIRNGSRKWLHRQVCRDFIPAEVIHRKKRGFAVDVVDAWFRGSLSERMRDYLLDGRSRMYNHLRLDKVKGMVNDHVSGRNDNHKLLFSLVVYEEWLRSFD